MYEDSGLAVIIDSGSGLTKAGFASEDAPRCVFPTVVGRPRKYAVFLGVKRNQVYVGADAQTRRGVLALKSPLDRGIITNWEDMERIWGHAIEDELRISAEDHPILLTEAPLSPASDRDNMAEIMFETFQAPAMHVEPQAVLAMYACKCTTGVVLDTGEGTTFAVPIHRGVAINDAVQKLDVAGADVTEQLMRMMNDRGHSFTTSSERQIIRDVKERLAYVALDVDHETAAMKACEDKEYTLPDGHVIKVGSERFRCTESLFTPSTIGSKGAGLATLIFDAIMNCDEKLHEELYQNIHISGGNSMFPGLVDRILNDLTALVPEEVEVHIEAPDGRQYMVWLGGSIMASVPLSDYMWLTKQQYAEHGRYHYGCYDPIAPSEFRRSKMAKFDRGPVAGEELILALKQTLSKRHSNKAPEDSDEQALLESAVPPTAATKRKSGNVEIRPSSQLPDGDTSVSGDNTATNIKEPVKNQVAETDRENEPPSKPSSKPSKRKSVTKEKEKGRDCMVQ